MKRDPKNSRRPNDGAANLAMLKRTVKKLFSYYPVLAPVTFACILFSAIVTAIPSLFVQNVIQVIEKWYVSRDWVSAKAELIPILSLLISLYVLSIIAILVYKQLMAYMTQGFLDKLRQEMFGGMQDLPIRYFDTHQHGDIMSFYTNDIDTLRQLVSEAIPAFIQSGAAASRLHIVDGVVGKGHHFIQRAVFNHHQGCHDLRDTGRASSGIRILLINDCSCLRFH